MIGVDSSLVAKGNCGGPAANRVRPRRSLCRIVRRRATPASRRRGHPSPTRDLLTVLLGAAAIGWLATLFPRRRTMRQRHRRGRTRFTARLALFPLALKLLSNPIIRSYVRGAVARRISRKLRR